MNRPLLALVLAAGEGRRFRSETNKVLHPLLGRSMLRLVCETVLSLKPVKTSIVIGRQREAVMEEALLLGVGFIHQKEPKGTAGAVLAARNLLRENADSDILIVPADLPLVRPAALRTLLLAHRRGGNAATVLSADIEDPSGFGRIIRTEDGGVRIVEDKEADRAQRAIREVHTSVYAFRTRDLLWALSKVSNKNKAGEYYLTDVPAILSAAGKKVKAVKTPNPRDIVQVNTRADLSRAMDVLRERKIREVSESGVTVLNPASTWIDLDVEIGRDTVVYPSVVLEGRTTVGRGCRLYPGVHVIHSRLADRVTVFSWTVMEDVTIEEGATVGPFARLRPKTFLRAGSHVGNFVEMKNTDFGRGAKAGHLSYLGDSEIQEKVNIGAGTITCNYDGVLKNRTIIEAGAFIGSGTQLVAPVRVGRGAYVAAGSVITKDVSPGALAVARGRQIEKAGWARRKRDKQKGESHSR
jgi:bifunctional UDP-N-acetylglucosamine pyrophosphorylase/glucosamine-1-phosphate N-acetyltransferase